MNRYAKELQEEINSTPEVQYDTDIREEIFNYMFFENYRE